MRTATANVGASATVLSEHVMNEAEAEAATATTKVQDGEEVESSGAGSFGRVGPEGHRRRTY